MSNIAITSNSAAIKVDKRLITRCNICGVKATNWLAGMIFPDTLPICSNPVCKKDTLELIKLTLLEAQGGL